MVLRPQEDGFVQFIGEAYVHDSMDAEAFVEEDSLDIRIRCKCHSSSIRTRKQGSCRHCGRLMILT